MHIVYRLLLRRSSTSIKTQDILIQTFLFADKQTTSMGTNSSSADEIANVNFKFLTTISYTYYKIQ